jgi:hypothetical protein
MTRICVSIFFCGRSPQTRAIQLRNEHKFEGVATPGALEYFQTKAIPELHASIGED